MRGSVQVFFSSEPPNKTPPVAPVQGDRGRQYESEPQCKVSGSEFVESTTVSCRHSDASSHSKLSTPCTCDHTRTRPVTMGFP